jgi:hypothetical protein
MVANLLARKETAFVLWRMGHTTQPPALIIGQLQLGTPITFINEQHFTLQPVPGSPDLFEIPAATCNLIDGQVYHPAFPILKYHTVGSTYVNLLPSMEISGRAMVAWEAPHV